MRTLTIFSLCLLTMGAISCQDDTLDFERISNFEVENAKVPLSARVGDSLTFDIGTSSELIATIEPTEGKGNFLLDGVALSELDDVQIGEGRLGYLPLETGTHSGRIILLNSASQRDTVEYLITVTKNIPDYNARLYFDTLSEKYILYLKQQHSEEVIDAVYVLEVEASQELAVKLRVPDKPDVYRLGDKINISYQAFIENGYEMPIDLELIFAEEEDYELNFVIADENDKSVKINKRISFIQENVGSPSEDEQVDLPDFNARVFYADSEATFNMYLKQQNAEDVNVEYRIHIEGGFNDVDIELEIRFAEQDQLYRLGDIITVNYREFEKNDYILPFSIIVVEAAKETYDLRFVVEDSSGKTVTVTKKFELGSRS